MIHPTNIGDTLPQEIGTTTLPTDFPQNTPVPAFTLGDRVRWKLIDSDPTDFGTIIRFFYAYNLGAASPTENRLHHWHWKYLIFLDPTSASHSFCLADTAWENHLEHHEHTAPTRTKRNRTHPEICQLAMHPRDFEAKWDVTRMQMATLCGCSLGNVKRWFRNDQEYP